VVGHPVVEGDQPFGVVGPDRPERGGAPVPKDDVGLPMGGIGVVRLFGHLAQPTHARRKRRSVDRPTWIEAGPRPGPLERTGEHRRRPMRRGAGAGTGRARGGDADGIPATRRVGARGRGTTRAGASHRRSGRRAGLSRSAAVNPAAASRSAKFRSTYRCRRGPNSSGSRVPRMQSPNSFRGTSAVGPPAPLTTKSPYSGLAIPFWDDFSHRSSNRG